MDQTFISRYIKRFKDGYVSQMAVIENLQPQMILSFTPKI